MNKGLWKRREAEKSKTGTFLLRLEIPQHRRDSHFPTAPTMVFSSGEIRGKNQNQETTMV